MLAADAVVCDRLAMPALPCDLPAKTEIHFVGKTAGSHPIPQEEINALLREKALLKTNPEMAKILAFSTRIVVVIGQRVIEIH